MDNLNRPLRRLMPRNSRMISWLATVTRWEMITSRNVAVLMNPRPPTSIRTIRTPCPARLQWVAVSTTTRPVTVLADVAVNSAVRKGVNRPVVLK